MNFIKAKRGRAKAAISRAATFAESVDTSTTLTMLEVRLESLKKTWIEFVELQNALYEFLADPNFVDPEPEYEEYEMKYFLAHSILTNFIHVQKMASVPSQPKESVIEQLASQQASFLNKLNTSNVSTTVKLPHLSIPTFSGDYKDWPAFRDSFQGPIDCNSTLSSTQKLQYLKSFLSGEASNLLKHIVNSDSNYLEAWDRLESRYDRTHLIVESFIQSFLSLPISNTPNVILLRKITDGADEVIRGLNSLESNGRDPWLIYILLQKLDPETKQAWAELIGSRDDATFKEMLEFLQNRCVCLESCYIPSRSTQARNKVQGVIRTHLVESNHGCPKCKLDHSLLQCKHFLALSIDARRTFVKEQSLCFNCLRQGHSSNKCRSNNRCRTCGSRHHTLVHRSTSSSTSTSATSSSSSSSSSNSSTPTSSSSTSTNTFISTSPSDPPTSSNSPPATNSLTLLCSHTNAVDNSCKPIRTTQTLLPTAIARAHDKQGVLRNIRLLLDSGSQVSFVTEQTVQRLGLNRKPARIPVSGVASISAGVTNGVVTLHIFSCVSNQSVEIQCYVISKITSLVPAFVSTISDKNAFSSYALADPKFCVPGHIDVLIGADKVFSVFNGSPVHGQQGQPDLVPTIFGWVVSGNMENRNSLPTYSVDSFCTQLDTTFEFDLERFWRFEEVAHEPALSVEDQQCEDIFAKSHSRLPDGRYLVQLPFKSNQETDFGNSLNVALNRFKYTEHKIASNQYLRDKYVDFMREYLSLGHMEEVPTNETNISSHKCYYLPHHAVMKEDSSTTKVRVVFDGSAKSGHHKSLNETLLIGQTYQRDLFSICIRFRRHLYTLSGDIEKMFRQIRVSRNHSDFQRILWRESSDQPLKHYRLLTVTYGTACAPFLAVRTLYQLALDSIDTYPRAAAI